MYIYKEIEKIREHRFADPNVSWGLVPTMGYLHDGHLSLVRKARRENDYVGVSIFVNPIQFNNSNDLTAYPRDAKRDHILLEEERVDLIWEPTPDIVYPVNFQTYVEVEKLTQPLEGAARPGHFKGVTTVVAKLFNVFQPHRAYFGGKDYQQLAVIKRMVRDLNFNIEIVVCPIVREEDGLAMSSRNAKLSNHGRKQATCLYKALTKARHAIKIGERNGDSLRQIMKDVINAENTTSIDYLSVAHPDTLAELEFISDKALFSVAVFIENIRLIDNIEVQV